MKVLLQTRAARSVAMSPGGDVVQAHETAGALRHRGLEVDVSSELEPDLTDYDAVHLFNVVRPHETWLQATNAVNQGRKVLLSTVYCDTAEFDRAGRRALTNLATRSLSRDKLEAVKALGRAALTREFNHATRVLLRQGYTRLQLELLELADAFLPNSRSEMRRLKRDLGIEIAASRIFPVPNGIDPDYYHPAALESNRPPAHLAKYSDCVLCVARIGGAKNQLSLVRAMRDLRLPLVLVGQTSATQFAYLRRLRREAGEDVDILGFVTDDEKRWLYQLARVHVLPSWIETTGLSSLEAAAMECAVVTTERGDTREYFGDLVDYCDPADVSTIRVAVARAYESGPLQQLAEIVRDQYTWDRAAEATLRAYAYAGLTAGACASAETDAKYA
jgi:glycosyltransferase involved in cell wall biosynthesis